MEIPQNYQTVMPYLILKNASGFIEFMQQVFHAELTNKTMRDENCIMHGEVMVGKSTIMFADSNDQYPPRPAGLFIYVDHADEAYQRAISKGATGGNRNSQSDLWKKRRSIGPFWQYMVDYLGKLELWLKADQKGMNGYFL